MPDYSAGWVRALLGLLPHFFLEPQFVVLLGPVDVDGALAHGLECTFHADSADVDVAQHGSDEEHPDNRVHDLSELHAFDACSVEREQQQIPGHGRSATADHHNPVNHFLAGVEPVGGRMVVANNAASALDPFDVNAAWNIAPDPHQQDQHNADGEREAEIVVRVLCQFRPSREGFGPKQGQQQRLTEGNVESGKGKDDEAGRRHPVHGSLKGVEAFDLPARTPALDLHHSAREIEDDEQGEHADNRDAANPAQCHFMKVPPFAPLRLLQCVGLHVRDRAAALDAPELLQQLLFLHRACGRVDRRRCCARRHHRDHNES